MVWSTPIALMSGGGVITITINSDTYIGNLWTYLGTPSGEQAVTVIVDGADAGDIQITPDWTGGSTFQITCINGGRVIGLGGNGGAGGADLGATGQAGVNGSSGGAAITASSGVTVNLDIDDGYLFGGGGGGGGGSYTDTGVAGDPGSGGGGGQGFYATTGGAAGSPSGTPVAAAGAGGTKSAPGAGGTGSVSTTSYGGGGGGWGSGGQAGNSYQIAIPGSFGLQYYGGVGGTAGRAFYANGGALNLNGATSEAALISAGRIKGEIGPFGAANFTSIVKFVSVAGASTTSITLRNDGDVLRNPGAQTTSTQWATGTLASFGDDYEIRTRNTAGSNDTSGTWTATPAAAGTWIALTSDRTYSLNSAAGIESAASAVEIRLATQTGTDIICSFIVTCADENGV